MLSARKVDDGEWLGISYTLLSWEEQDLTWPDRRDARAQKILPARP